MTELGQTIPTPARSAHPTPMEETRLLYVDKSTTAQRLLAGSMEPICQFVAANSLAQARQKIAAQTFTLFVLDYELPDGTGLDLARQLRRDPRHGKTPILLYAASLNNELAYQAMQAGINDSLAKPMNMLDLRDHIVQLIEVPQIKTVCRELLQLTCFAWNADAKHHEYSPDLNLHLEGENPEQVRQQMQEALEQEILSKKDPGQYPADINIMKHVINMQAQNPV